MNTEMKEDEITRMYRLDEKSREELLDFVVEFSNMLTERAGGLVNQIGAMAAALGNKIILYRGAIHKRTGQIQIEILKGNDKPPEIHYFDSKDAVMEYFASLGDNILPIEC